MINSQKAFNHTVKNYLHTLVLFLGMGVILSVLGFLLAGIDGVLWSFYLGIFVLVISPNIPPAFIISLYGGQLLTVDEAPGLYQMAEEISDLANLSTPPKLYYLPSQIMNAFSVGTRGNSAIGVSDALLKNLTHRELMGVLAHEISHIQHNDVRVMSYADVISRIINVLSFTGLLLVFFNLPLMILGLLTVSWFALGVLLVAPTLMSLLQLSLSRIRELEADRQAVLLTGDPEGLASALRKIEANTSKLSRFLYQSGHSVPIPSVLRTHPDTEERIKQLLSLRENRQEVRFSNYDNFTLPARFGKNIRKPRWHVGGFWY